MEHTQDGTRADQAWQKYWTILRSIWETLKYTVHYMGEKMDRTGNESKDIVMLWRLSYAMLRKIKDKREANKNCEGVC